MDQDDFILDEPTQSHDPILDLTSKPRESPTDRLLRAHIAVLVSALGGPDHTRSPPTYVPGHDALACLKDIKRWLRAVDERNGTGAVALACAESKLVVNDLIPILCINPKHVARKQWHQKVALLALEVLVLLTWPLDRKIPNYAALSRMQLTYKKAILLCAVVKNIIKLALPLLAKPRLDREPRDNAVMRLVLFFLRNVLFIEPIDPSLSTKTLQKLLVVGDTMPPGVSPEDVSVAAVATVFKKSNALMFILTVASALGSDLDKELLGGITTEVVFLIVRGIDPKVRVGHTPQTHRNIDINASTPLKPLTSTAGMNLADLLETETRRKNTQNKNLQTRHGRFGTLVSLRSGDDTNYVVSGQHALRSTHATLDKIDSQKKWTERTKFKYDSDEFVRRREPPLSELLEFVEQFLSGGCFNTVVDCASSHMAAVSDMTLIDEYDKAAYFLMVGWFFEYEREQKSRKVGENKKNDDGKNENEKNGENTNEENENGRIDGESDQFGAVGAALGEINFILLISLIRDSFSHRRWSTLHTALRCFHEILLVATQLFHADGTQRDLAEGIFRKLFSLSDFIGLLVQIPQTAAKHSPEYLRTCVDVVHTILKSFESFANEDVRLYVQQRRRQRKKEAVEVGYDSDDEVREARSRIQERKLDFAVTEARFFHTQTITAHIVHFSRYEELSAAEIKRCLRYFHRLFVARKDFGALYRLDFMNVLHRVRNHVARGSSLRAHIDEFICYFMKKFKQAIQRWPLPIELLFPRFEDPEARTFVSTGELYLKPDKALAPRLAGEVEFVREMLLDEQIKVLVGAIGDRPRFWQWLEIGGTPAPAVKRTLINNAYIRLLVSKVGYILPFSMEDPVDAEKINEEVMGLVKKYLAMQPLEFEDGKDATFFLRAKEVDIDDEYYDGQAEDDDEGIAFVTEATGTRQNVHELDMLEDLERSIGGEKGRARKKRKPKPQKAKRMRSEEEDEPRAPRAPASHISVKSAEFIHDSDDESDEERERTFFEREEQLRQMLAEMGGIVNPQQLQEFKLAWRKISNGTASVQKAVEEAEAEVSLFVDEESDNENQRAFEPKVFEPKAVENVSEDDDDAETSETGDEMSSRASTPQERESERVVKRRRVVVSDDED